LLALFRDVMTDAQAGIHRIALTADAQKIDRRMLGRWSNPRVIKLWSLIKLDAAPKRLYFGEGIETMLAAATRQREHGRPMWPAWAAAASGNVAKFPVVAGVDELVILADRGAAGTAAAAECRRTWRAAERAVRCLRTGDPACNDFKDLVHKKLKRVQRD
jgi:hypothetical protein